ncbi:dipeptidase D [Colwellia chukchiensis]|uniref:Dipeptidase D n=1 Tax=Colwellia chukchiensis TaxID=641665 RepID=A0A1H7GY23_9GAMM|nr:dipeptidase [Colwellia chukchiensis]SEK42407.1 dipeptidase D [Colwellia chukchiensis]
MLRKITLLSATLVFSSLLSLSFSASANTKSTQLSQAAKATADYAVTRYQDDMVESLRALVKHNTVAVDGLGVDDNPAHVAFKAELKKQAQQLGFDYSDHGYVVVIGLGKQKERVGVITHGDVQPVDPSKWQKSPFELDTSSEPGRLIGRGTEDDKGPIASALYAMKAIKDNKIALNKRIELYVYMAEESDWQPLKDYIKEHDLPEINITLDAEYPVVTAEKGYGTIKLLFNKQQTDTIHPYISEFTGGFFGSQIPEDASATINNANIVLLEKLMRKAGSYQGLKVEFELIENTLTIKALGKSAHSSKPEEGLNAIPYLADLLSDTRWINNGPGTLVNFINDNIGLGLEGKKFGNIAYQDEFMGPMTVSPTVIKQADNSIELNINLRRPQGKSKQQLHDEIHQAVQNWNHKFAADVQELEHYIGEPFVQKDAPHIDTLLAVFSHYTGIKDAKPIAIGGGTNSRLFPNAVSFGPSMPNTAYTGHSEHEFITMAQFVLNLKMYTAVLVELAQ